MSLEARGTIFVAPGMETYDGMIVGEHSRDTDLDVNPVRTKELTNIRAPGKDENVHLSPSCLELMKGVNQVEVSSNPFDTTLLAAQMLIREKQALQQQMERELQTLQQQKSSQLRESSGDAVLFPIDAKGRAVAASDSATSVLPAIRSEDV